MTFHNLTIANSTFQLAKTSATQLQQGPTGVTVIQQNTWFNVAELQW